MGGACSLRPNHLLIQEVKKGKESSANSFRLLSLIKLGANVNIVDDEGLTPLHYAVEYSDQKVAELLLQKGADVNAVTRAGYTALHCAAENGDDTLIAVLLQAEADVNVKTDKGTTPVMIAAYIGFYKCVEMLIKSGADVNVGNDLGKSALINCFTSARFRYNVMHKFDVTPRLAKLLLSRPVNRIKCMQLLLKAGAHVNRLRKITTRPGKSFLITIYTQCEKLLCAAGEIVNKIDNDNNDDDANSDNDGDYDITRKEEEPFSLKRMCRKAIRDHLLLISCQNLFVKVPQLGLPRLLESYLVYDISLYTDFEDETEVGLEIRGRNLQKYWKPHLTHRACCGGGYVVRIEAHQLNYI